LFGERATRGLDKYDYKGYYLIMITVGVRNLKDQLSRYLQYVKDGEKVIITEHNRIIAEISVPEKRDLPAAFEQRLIELSKEGKVILAKRNTTRARKPEDKLNLDWKTIYDEVRKDRV
jgi:antitoxin (DNA-binding transcriptional repressor) of toxin-antitoxin stability system